jgi:putative transposase
VRQRRWEGYTEIFRVHQDEPPHQQELMLDLDEIARQGARRMLAQALDAEVEAYLDAAKDQRDEHGHALVVRNGRAGEREILCGARAVEIRTPRVNDRRIDEHGERRRFKRVIVPPYMRRSPKVCEVLPLLYLHGLSSGDFVAALKEFFGTEADLSAASITRLTREWQQER